MLQMQGETDARKNEKHLDGYESKKIAIAYIKRGAIL